MVYLMKMTYDKGLSVPLVSTNPKNSLKQDYHFGWLQMACYPKALSNSKSSGSIAATAEGSWLMWVLQIPGHGESRDRCFIASSRDFEESWQDLNSPYSVLD